MFWKVIPTRKPLTLSHINWRQEDHFALIRGVFDSGIAPLGARRNQSALEGMKQGTSQFKRFRHEATFLDTSAY